MSFDPEKINFFAKTDARGQQIPFGIKAKDRQRHMYVVGKTGMGKSTLLENMAAQDIKNGEGMAFIDPHGSAAETLLDYVPEHRIDDVIYFAPFDLSNPISFNVMEDVGPDKRHLVVSGLMSTFKKIWVDAWSARMEYILTNALLALIEYPDTTLLSVNRLFSDKAYRNLVVNYIKDPAVKAFWTEEFANYTDRFAAEALPAIQNKIGQFTGNPLIRNIIGQPHSSFDIRKIMDEKKILIMNLSKGLVGETNANLLGSMLTTRIYLAAMSRADIPVEKMKTMPNFYFYVDEFQSFANSTFANILSEARKYHLNLIIAHQYIEQMEEEVRSAVFGNVGTTIAFRVGPFDAEVLETVFAPRFVATDLVNLGFAQIYLTLMIDGIGSQPFSAVTLPPVERPRMSCKDMVIAASRRNYTRGRDDVEKVVADLHTPTKVEPPVRKNNNNSNYNQNKPEGRKETNYRPPANTPDFKKKEDSFAGKKIEPVKVDENVKVEPKRLYRDEGVSPEKFDHSRKDKGLPERQEYKEKPKNKPPKPATDSKSLGDLRAVLSKISQENNNKKNNSVKNNTFKSSPHKSVEDKKDESFEKNEKKDLRGALSALLGDKDNNIFSKPEPEKKEEKNDTEVKKINFLPTVIPTGNIDPIEHIKVKEKEEIEKLALEIDSFFEAMENELSGVTSILKFNPDEGQNKNHHPKTSDNKRKQFFKDRNQHQRSKDDNSPLSPRRIEKRLRQPRGERTPFAS